MSGPGGDVDLVAASRPEGHRFRIEMESCDPVADSWTHKERKTPQLSRPAQCQAACVSATELQRVNNIEIQERQGIPKISRDSAFIPPLSRVDIREGGVGFASEEFACVGPII